MRSEGPNPEEGKGPASSVSTSNPDGGVADRRVTGNSDPNENLLLNKSVPFFLVDQVQQMCCPLFKAARAKYATRRYLWERIRSCFNENFVPSMELILDCIVNGVRKPKLEFQWE
ncbi:hypothetical protein GF1_03670 [Desulfolithobacter dissulfuricans]|uniref:Uncharacterized protein n=1 Tax=Desulfolithobacter dissulfuricans TaxID=2795293 RepID=A0A915XKA2_9BACT|nr:hypothetical protein GF1_03670 [Desulfolithobacter dissulfuricans]